MWRARENSAIISNNSRQDHAGPLAKMIRGAGSALLAIAALAPLSPAQKVVSTIAGGGPNNLPGVSANLNEPQLMAADSAGNYYIAARGQNRIFKVDSTGQLTVFAGNGVAGYEGDAGPAIAAELNTPQGVAIDNSGNIFIADTGNNVIRKITAATGVIQTVAGNTRPQFAGDGGPATSASLYEPWGVFVDSSGNIFIADSANSAVREVLAASGNIQTVAGRTGPGPVEFPEAVFVDSSGNLFFSDGAQNVVDEIPAGTTTLQTVAGTGVAGYSGDGGPATSAQLSQPFGIFVDGSGNLFVADTQNSVVREVSGGTIQTIAGVYPNIGDTGDGGPATNAQLGSPAGIFEDAAQNLFISDISFGVVREITHATGNIQTVVGNGQFNISGDGSLATDASIDDPWGVVYDSSGNLYFTSFYGNFVGEVSASTGKMQILAGNGTGGYAGDGGSASAAEFYGPTGIAVDSTGNIYIADQGNHRIREIVASTGNIQTIAGTGTSGYSGDGGPAVAAEVGYPTAVIVDLFGNVYFADQADNVVREIVASTGTIQTIAGDGTRGYSGDGGSAASAELNQPFGVALDSSGNIFISDSGNSVIRMVSATTGNIETVAGNSTWGYSGDGGPATSAELQGPDDILVDAAENIFIADSYNNVIREVDGSTGVISTAAGNGTADFCGDGDPALQACFDLTTHVTQDLSGNFVIADLNNSRVRSISALTTVEPPIANLSANAISFPTELVTAPSTSESVNITDNSVQALAISSISISGTNSSDFQENDNCGTGVAAGATCTVNVTFTPSGTGARTATLTITDDSGKPQPAIRVSRPIADGAAGSGSSQQSVSLSGAGIDFAIASASGGSTTATVTAGQTASYSLQLSATGGASSNDSVSVTIACAGAPAETTCHVPASAVTATSATAGTFQITISTTANSDVVPSTAPENRALRGSPLLASGALVALLLLVGLAIAARRASAYERGVSAIVPLAALGLLLAQLILLAACGGGHRVPTGGTQPGSYTVTVTGTSGAVSHTTSLTLVVQ